MPFELKSQDIEPKKEHKATKMDIFMYNYSFLVLIIFLAVILGASFFTFLKPKYEKVLFKYTLEFEEKKSEASTLKANEAKLTQYLIDYNSISDYEKEIIDKIVPEEDQYELLYAEMDRLASDRGCILKKITITREDDKEKEEESDNNIGKLEVDVTLEGVNYEGFKMFLAALERNMKLMDVREVNFDPNKNTAEYKFLTYYSKSQKDEQ